MDTFCIDLDSLETINLPKSELFNLVGGKAYNLGKLIHHGFRVPKCFCITTTAYQTFLEESGLQKLLEEKLELVRKSEFSLLGLSEFMEEKIDKQDLHEKVVELIIEAYLKLKGNTSNLRVAVRSSATAEDLLEASFAGQQESFLNVEDQEQLIKSVKACWKSLWSYRAMHYRAQKGIPQEKVKIAVIVQKMVEPEVAGVMFTVNPISQNRDELLIEASLGLGEALVSGNVTGDQYVIERRDLSCKQKIESQPTHKPMLNKEVVRNLSQTGLSIETLFDFPQDIEWAWSQGSLHILQSRAITTLTNIPKSYKLPHFYSNRFERDWVTAMAERYPNPLYPIDIYIVQMLLKAQLDALNQIGFSVTFTDLSLLNKLDFPFEYPAFKVKPTLKLLRLIAGFKKSLEGDPNELWINQYQKDLDLITKSHKELDISSATEEQLLFGIDNILEGLPSIILARFVIYFRYSLISSFFETLLKIKYKQESYLYSSKLLRGIPSQTMNCNIELQSLAQQVYNNMELRDIFLQTSISDLLPTLESSPHAKEILNEYKELRQKYGHREISMPLIGEPCWNDQPLVLLGIIRGMVKDLSAPKILPNKDETLSMSLAGETTPRVIWKIPMLTSLFNKTLKRTREFIAFRENSHMDLSRALHCLKVLSLELGQRLKAKGILEHPQDVRFLTFQDIRNSILSPCSIESVKHAKDKIDREMGTYQERTKIRNFLLGQNLNCENPTLNGIAASPGLYEGTVRIIRDITEFHTLQPGEVLVAPFTNPTWTPLFTIAGAVIVETGGAASHAAIVAREYEIPAVMGVQGATNLLKNGQIVTVNGYQGHVKTKKETFLASQT